VLKKRPAVLKKVNNAGLSNIQPLFTLNRVWLRPATGQFFRETARPTESAFNSNARPANGELHLTTGLAVNLVARASLFRVVLRFAKTGYAQASQERLKLLEDERRYKALTPDEIDRLLLAYKRLLEEGFCPPRLDDSILGLDWSLFRPRTFPEHGDDARFRNPPEFISLSFATLDAYAAAFLAADVAHDRLGELTFLCRLRQGQIHSQLQLEFVTIPERGFIFPRTALFQLLATFPGLLRAKNLKKKACYAAGAGCPMTIPYPGKMIAGLTPCLRDRPPDLWPEVFLRIVPTGELVLRARTAVQFAQDLDLIDNLISNGPS
jgi:hypothetical protein